MPRTKSRSSRAAPPRGYSAPALEKGIDIVEALAEAESGLTVSEISQRLERRMSELFRVIVVMEQRGWLQKDAATSRYSLTYHVLRLAHRGTPAKSLTLASSAAMHELSASINQSCHLVVRSGKQGLVILRQENQQRHANLSVRLGAVIDLVTSASGNVLLAFMDARDCEHLLQDGAWPAKPSRAAFEKTLLEIRRKGFDVRRSPITAGVTDISYPIRDFDGQVVAALTVPYLHVLDDSLPATVDETRLLLEECAGRVSHSLGWMR
jgi:DNA-binding IclR family transcriptional regulator